MRLLVLALLVGAAMSRHTTYTLPCPSSAASLPHCAIDPDCGRNLICRDDCNFAEAHPPVCVHSPLFPEFTLYDGLGTLALAICIVTASVAGIGGGGFNVPVFLLIFNFSLGQAKILSHFTICGNSLAQTLVNLRKREHGLPVIDLGTSVILFPALVAGHSVGITLFPMFPELFVMGLLVVMLLIACVASARKAYKTIQDERRNTTVSGKQAMNRMLFGRGLGGDDDGKDASVNAVGGTESEIVGLVAGASRDERVAAAALEWEVRRMMWMQLASVLLFTGWVTGVAYMMGGLDARSPLASVTTCNWAYWLLFVALLVCAVIVSIAGGHLQMVKHTRAQRRGAWQAHGGLDWSMSLVLQLGAASFGIGLAAGLVGIGGGEFLVPFLLMVGMGAQSASATSAFVILVTTAADAMHYGIVGSLSPLGDYAMWVAALGLCMGAIGRYCATKVSRRSVILVTLTVALLACAVLALHSGISDIDPDHVFEFTPQKMCGS